MLRVRWCFPLGVILTRILSHSLKLNPSTSNKFHKGSRRVHKVPRRGFHKVLRRGIHRDISPNIILTVVLISLKTVISSQATSLKA